MTNREPSCVLNHDMIRKDLAARGQDYMECPSCRWILRPPPLTEEQIEYIKRRLKDD